MNKIFGYKYILLAVGLVAGNLQAMKSSATRSMTSSVTQSTSSTSTIPHHRPTQSISVASVTEAEVDDPKTPVIRSNYSSDASSDEKESRDVKKSKYLAYVEKGIKFEKSGVEVVIANDNNNKDLEKKASDFFKDADVYFEKAANENPSAEELFTCGQYYANEFKEALKKERDTQKNFRSLYTNFGGKAVYNFKKAAKKKCKELSELVAVDYISLDNIEKMCRFILGLSTNDIRDWLFYKACQKSFENENKKLTSLIELTNEVLKTLKLGYQNKAENKKEEAAAKYFESAQRISTEVEQTFSSKALISCPSARVHMGSYYLGLFKLFLEKGEFLDSQYVYREEAVISFKTAIKAIMPGALDLLKGLVSLKNDSSSLEDDVVGLEEMERIARIIVLP